MSRLRALLPCGLVLWLSGGLWQVQTAAQVQAMPPSIALPAEAPRYAPALEMLSAGGGSISGDTYERIVAAGVGPADLSSQASGWSWHLLPDGLLYRSYLAGGREPRFSVCLFHERDQQWLADATLGSRIGLLRYGTPQAIWAEGWQLDVEAAAMPRVTLDEYRDLVSVDFRYGFPITFRQGPLETKFSYYHLSSHLSDEFLEHNPAVTRINFVRDVLVLGVALRPARDLRVYAEGGWAFHIDGGSQPWEFQFGIDCGAALPADPAGAPFLAVNARLREEVDFGGNMTVQTGWQWQSQDGRLFRTGLHYFNGQSDQYEFFREHEEQIGIGFWYDYSSIRFVPVPLDAKSTIPAGYRADRPRGIPANTSCQWH